MTTALPVVAPPAQLPAVNEPCAVITSPRTILGIDPGLSGAVALLHQGEYKALHDMPLVVDSDGKKTPNAHRVACWMREYQPDLVVIEQVGAMPRTNAKTGQKVKMGAQSMFNFGRGFGLVEAAAMILKLKIEYVRPAAWKRRAGLINAGKDTHRERAADLFPKAAYDLRLKKHDGRADALLIARYGHAHW